MGSVSLFLHRVVGRDQPKGFLSYSRIPTPVPISWETGSVGSHGTKHGPGGSSFCSGPGQGGLSPKSLCPRLVCHTSLVHLQTQVWIRLAEGPQGPGRRLWLSRKLSSNVLCNFSVYFQVSLVLPTPQLLLPLTWAHPQHTHTCTQGGSAAPIFNQTLTSAQLQICSFSSFYRALAPALRPPQRLTSTKTFLSLVTLSSGLVL